MRRAWPFATPRTKDAVSALAALGLEGKVLVVLGPDDEAAERSFANLPQVQKGSKELMDFVASGKGSWDKIYPLNQVVYKKMTRPKDADLTIYKFMGYGLADLA